MKNITGGDHRVGGHTTSARDKAAMRQRLLNTKMKEPGNIHIEFWTPGDSSQVITYEYANSLFGEILVAATQKGICFLGFTKNDRAAAFNDLKGRFPQNTIMEGISSFQAAAIAQVNAPNIKLPIRLHLKGTTFQLDIWKKLIQIPLGGLVTYAQLGGSSKIARATGAAVGRNPVGFLLPCHRVIYPDGSFDRYYWGPELKEKLLTWEAGLPSET